MKIPFSALILPDSIEFTSPDGTPCSVVKTEKTYDIIKSILMSNTTTEENYYDNFHADVSKRSCQYGHVSLNNGTIYYKHYELYNAITERIITGLGNGFQMESYFIFLGRLMQNSSHRTVELLFSFVENKTITITNNGHLICYKRVNEDYSDVFYPELFNNEDRLISLRRNQVDDDPSNDFLSGLWVSSFADVMKQDRNHGKKIMIVLVDPSNVVCIPSDYSTGNLRVCRYEVIKEYLGDQAIVPVSTSVSSAEISKEIPIIADMDSSSEDEYSDESSSSSSEEWYDDEDQDNAIAPVDPGKVA